MKPWAKAAVQGGACGLMLGLVLLIGGRVWQPPTVADVVRARLFEVVDAAGKASTVVSPSYLSLYDAAGNLRMSLSTDAGMPRLWLYDATPAVRVSLGLTARGSPSLEFRDKSGKSRAVLGSTSLETRRTAEATMRPESSLVLFDQDEKVIWKAP